MVKRKYSNCVVECSVHSTSIEPAPMYIIGNYIILLFYFIHYVPFSISMLVVAFVYLYRVNISLN